MTPVSPPAVCKKAIGSVCFIANGLLLDESPFYEGEDPHGAEVLERATHAVSISHAPSTHSILPSMLDTAQRVVRVVVSDDDLLEQARALGFETIEAMREHEAWLRQAGSAQYHAWLTDLLLMQGETSPS